MTLFQALIAFTIAAGLLTITPGVDTLMVLRTATIEGPRRALLATLGIGSGCLIWGVGVALGLGALIAAAPMLFLAVKWTGAAYLGWIGMGLLLRPRARLDVQQTGDAAAAGGALLWFRRGLLTNMLNPKMGVFYLSFLPVFVPHGYDPPRFMLLLAGLHVLMGLLWLGTLVAATLPLARLLARPVVVRNMDRACGALFVALAGKLALSR